MHSGAITEIKKIKDDNILKKITAEEAMDSKWLIGSPTNLIARLKYRS